MTIKIYGLDDAAVEGEGPDVIVTAPAIDLQDASPGLLPNPPRRKKMPVEHPELGDMYQGMSKLLVRTALIRAPDWEKGKRIKIGGPDDIAALCRHLVHADQEHLVTISMDGGMQVLAIHESSVGTSSSAEATVAQLVKVAFLTSGTRMAMVHNHPSGNPSPSPEDRMITTKIKEGLSCLNIELIDHVIVGYDGWFSVEVGKGASWGDKSWG